MIQFDPILTPGPILTNEPIIQLLPILESSCMKQSSEIDLLFF